MMPTSNKRSRMLYGLLKVTTWQVGPEAASHLIASIQWNFRSSVFLCIGAILIYLKGIATLTPTLIVGIIFCIVGGYCIVLMFKEKHQWRRSASRALSIDPPFRGRTTKKMVAQGIIPYPPPLRSAYIAWCEKYGQQPYPFRDAELPKVRTRIF